jgi:hypothetical protein
MTHAPRAFLFLRCSTSMQAYTREREGLERDPARLEWVVRRARNSRGVVPQPFQRHCARQDASDLTGNPMAGKKGP